MISGLKTESPVLTAFLVASLYLSLLVLSHFFNGLVAILALLLSMAVIFVLLKHPVKEEISVDYRYLLVFLVLAGLALRLYNLGTVSMWYDEAITANAAISLVENGVPVFPSGFEYWRSFPSLLLFSLSILVLGVSDFALRFPSAVVGSLTILLTYLAGREMFDRETGIIAAAFVAFTAWQVTWSRQVRMYALLQLLYLGAVLMIYRVKRRPDRKNLALLMLAVVLAMLVHVTAYILPLVALAYLLFNYRGKNQIKWFLSTSILLLIPVLLVSEHLYFSYYGVIDRMVFSPGNFQTYISWIASELTVLGFLGLIGAFIGLKEDRESGVLAILAVLPAFYIYSFHVERPATRYLYFMVPFLSIWAGISLKRLSGAVSIPYLERRHVLGVAVLGVLAVGALTWSYGLGLYAPQPDFKSAYNQVEQESSEGDVLAVGWTPPALYYYREPDYAVGNVSRKTLVNTSRDLYTGSRVLREQAELEDVINGNDRGWIVMDHRVNISSSNLQGTLSRLKFEAGYDEVYVWSWNSTSLQG